LFKDKASASEALLLFSNKHLKRLPPNQTGGVSWQQENLNCG
jgi:hypothetical protein